MTEIRKPSAQTPTSEEVAVARPELFFDGECPICRREVEFMQRRARATRVQFVDISAADFDASYYGKTREELMAQIHCRLGDGRWVVGVEAFRQVYSTLGFTGMVALTRLPLVRPVLDLGYRWFARNRLRFGGRCDASCGTGVCAAPSLGTARSPATRDSDTSAADASGRASGTGDEQ